MNFKIKTLALGLLACISSVYSVYSIDQTELLDTVATLEKSCVELMIRFVASELTTTEQTQDFQLLKPYFEREFAYGLMAKLNSVHDTKKHKFTPAQAKAFSSKLSELKLLADNQHKLACQKLGRTRVYKRYTSFGNEFLTLGSRLGEVSIDALVTVVKLGKDKKAAEQLLTKCRTISHQIIQSELNAQRVDALAKQYNLGFINRWKFRSCLSTLESECSTFFKSAVDIDLLLK